MSFLCMCRQFLKMTESICEKVGWAAKRHAIEKIQTMQSLIHKYFSTQERVPFAQHELITFKNHVKICD